MQRSTYPDLGRDRRENGSDLSGDLPGEIDRRLQGRILSPLAVRVIVTSRIRDLG